MPWARSFCPFRACGAYLRNLRNILIGIAQSMGYADEFIISLLIIEQQLSSHFHHYTSRCSSPWLEQIIAGHLLNSERLP